MAGDSSEIFHQETLAFEGKEYILKRPTFPTRGVFVSWLEAEAIAAVARHREAYGDSFGLALDQARRDCVTKAYGWKRQAWADAVNNNEHAQIEICYLMLKQEQPSDEKLTREFVREKLWEAPGGVVVDKDGKGQSVTKGVELLSKVLKLVNVPN